MWVYVCMGVWVYGCMGARMYLLMRGWWMMVVLVAVVVVVVSCGVTEWGGRVVNIEQTRAYIRRGGVRQAKGS